MDKEKVFDYLLVPGEVILDNYENIAQDYWNSTVEMNSENRHSGREYRCYVVCVGYTREQRKRLSDRTGIPLGRITSVDRIKGGTETGMDFASRVKADSLRNDDFLGRIKVYASERKFPRTILTSSVEVVYAE